MKYDDVLNFCTIIQTRLDILSEENVNECEKLSFYEETTNFRTFHTKKYLSTNFD